MVMAFDMLDCRNGLGSKGCGMMQNLIADSAIIQTINESFWNFHKTPLLFKGLSVSIRAAMRMVSMRGKPPALAPLDGRGKQAQQDETGTWHTIQLLHAREYLRCTPVLRFPSFGKR